MADARALKQPALAGQQYPDDGPIVGLRVVLGRRFWRIGPGWAVLAGALVAGAGVAGGADLLRLAGALVLGDAAWGTFWELTSAPGASMPAPEPRVSLPYLNRRAPLSRLARDLQGSALARRSGGSWHALLLSALLMLGLSAMLGVPAVALSLAVVLIVAVTWLVWYGRQRPATVQALLSVGLPWLLGMAVLGGGREVLSAQRWLPGLVLGASFTVLHWGVHRGYRSPQGGTCGIWLGQGLVVAALIVLDVPATLALVAGILAPPSFWLAQKAALGLDVDEMVWRSSPWWLLGMLLAASGARA